MTHTLEADGIILEFGSRRVLSDIYVKCETGKITGLLGRNGMGKTCLMNIVYGSLVAESKSIRFNRTSIPKAYQQPELITYLPQFNFIPAFLSVKNIFSDFNLNYDDFKLFFPEFTATYHSPIRNLSGGLRRLIEVYIIIKSKSAFSLLDEPFSHVMPLHIDSLKEILLTEKKNKGFLITDHLFRQVTDISDDIYVLTNGKTHLTSNLTDIERLGYARL